MKLMKIVLSFAFFLMVTATTAQNADSILGTYHLPNNLDVKIYKQGQKYYGKIIALTNDKTGAKNIQGTDRIPQDRSLIGKVIIKDLEYDKDNNEWINGVMYAPGKDMYFNLKVTEVHPDYIVVVGSKFILRKTLVWKRTG